MRTYLGSLFALSLVFATSIPQAKGAAPERDAAILREAAIERAVAEGVPKESLLRIYSFLDANIGKEFSQETYYCRDRGPESLEACPKGPKRILATRKVHIVDHGYAVIVNLGQPSTEKRYYVVELATGQTWKTYTAHGRGSGKSKWATKFSNIEGSFQSALGLYLVGGMYTGHYKRTLRLYGLETSNDQAYLRDIVMHPADYADESSIYATDKTTGQPRMRLGLSLGCPAVPAAFARAFFPALENGAILDIYHPALMKEALSGKEVSVTSPDAKPHE